MNKFIKYFLSFLAVLLLGTAVFFGAETYRYYQSPQYEAEKYFADLRKKYEADTYGGSTPEETLQLFVDALKKGDVDLASKYFVIEEQERWKNKILEITNKQKLSSMIDDLMGLELTTAKDKEVFYTLVNDKREVIVEMVFKKINNRWKISEL